MSSMITAPNRTAFILSTALLLIGICAGSNSFSDEPVRSETVRFHDLNVGTPEGVQALYNRIHSAAKRVCSDEDPVLALGAPACARKAEAKAIEKLNLPQLVAYFNLKTKGVGHTQAFIAAR